MTEKSTTQLPDVTVPTSASLPVQTPAPSLISEDAVRVAAAKQPSIWDALHVPKDVQESTKAIGQIVGAVSTAVSWVGTVQSALKLAGFIKPEPNPFDTLFQRIQGELRILLAATLAGATEERLRDVAEQVAIARTAAQNANEYILLGRPKDQFHIGRMALADRDSLSVINVLAAAEWWQRSYDPTPAIIIGPAVEGPPSLVASDYWWHPPEGGVLLRVGFLKR